MADPIWQNLQKSLDDPETIEQAITRIVGDHNNSPDSHLGAGQSLENHKMADIIDHPAGSVKNDKVSFGLFNYDVNFIDELKYSGDDAFYFTLYGVLVFQSVSGNGFYSFGRSFDSSFVKMSDSNSKMYSIDASFISSSWNASSKFRFGYGFGTFSDNDFVGYQLEGNTLYCVALKNDGSQYRYAIPSWNVFEKDISSYLFLFDSTKNTISWIINNNLVHEVSIISNNITTELDPEIIFSADLDSLGSYEPEFSFYNLRFSVDTTY